MRTIIMSLTLVMAISNQLLSQANFKSGTLTLKQGSTQVGMILDKDWQGPIREIRFQSENGEPSTYTLDQIQAFTIGDDVRYENYIVGFNHALNDTKNPLPSPVLEMQEKPALLRVLIGGTRKLLVYVDIRGREHFYLQKGNENPTELIQFYYTREKELSKEDAETLIRNPRLISGKTVLYQYNGYKEQLAKAFGDSPALKSDIQKLKYRGQNFISLFQKYYQSQGINPDFMGRYQTGIFQIGIQGAYLSTKYRITDYQGVKVPSQFDPEVDTKPEFGVFLNYILPGKNQHWGIGMQITYHSWDANGDHINGIFRDDFSFSNQYLLFKPGVRYRIGLGKVIPYIDAGAVLGVNIFEDNYKNKYLIDGSEETFSQRIELFDSRSFLPGLFVSLGFDIGRFGAYVNYNNTIGIADTGANHGEKFSSFSAGLKLYIIE